MAISIGSSLSHLSFLTQGLSLSRNPGNMKEQEVQGRNRKQQPGIQQHQGFRIRENTGWNISRPWQEQPAIRKGMNKHRLKKTARLVLPGTRSALRNQEALAGDGDGGGWKRVGVASPPKQTPVVFSCHLLDISPQERRPLQQVLPLPALSVLDVQPGLPPLLQPPPGTVPLSRV